MLSKLKQFQHFNMQKGADVFICKAGAYPEEGRKQFPPKSMFFYLVFGRS